MKINPEKITSLIKEIDTLLGEISSAEWKSKHLIEEVHPSFQKSAQNLVHYRALRTMDITGIQMKLKYLGLSRVARAEAHVFASLQNSRFILKTLIGDESTDEVNRHISIKKANKVHTTHTKNLLGYRSKGRRVRIMVTLPSEAAYNYDLVHNLLESGMNTARINCAHDGPIEWMKMIEHLNRAKDQLKKNCRISMDLAGPKIRTGSIEPGPRVRRFRPRRNEYGEVIEMAHILLVSELEEGHK